MPKLSQRGVIPLVALIIAGIIVVVGGSYFVRNDLLNTNKITDSSKSSSGQKSTPAPKLAPIKSGLDFGWIRGGWFDDLFADVDKSG